MSRSSLLLMAALAAGGFGCAHCDTCDDFPAPCTGPNCGFQGYPIGAELPGGPTGAPIVPVPVGPSHQVPVGPPVGSPVADPAPATPPPDAPSEGPSTPETPPPLPDSPPLPSEAGPSTSTSPGPSSP
jgi:hypothetical protein